MLIKKRVFEGYESLHMLEILLSWEALSMVVQLCLNFHYSGLQLYLHLDQLLQSKGQLKYLEQLRSSSKERGYPDHEAFQDWYKGYKEKLVKNLKFDPDQLNLSQYTFIPFPTSFQSLPFNHSS